jgi:hypothetical protein
MKISVQELERMRKKHATSRAIDRVRKEHDIPAALENKPESTPPDFH